ncbi:hypothetical protein Gotri_019414 [Gossypium trilobum]|uniref:DUF7745 domain-containing protein n=1 Tax=Gossypium trilobum TaxID=34281 RepID=A0A7J9ECV2_9ROSI|nr:hypothetical protein [Gossypium trilobum]
MSSLDLYLRIAIGKCIPLNQTRSDFTRISVAQNDLQELKEVWEQWDDETNQLFYCNYDDLPYLLDVKVDKHLFRALAQYWNPAYSCFTFGKSCQRPEFLKKANEYNWDERDLILAHPDMKKRVDLFSLSFYGLFIFPTALGHINEAVSDLFDRLDKRVTPVPTSLAEIFRSFGACQRAGEGRFIRCAQLLLAWFHSHFWKLRRGETTFLGNSGWRFSSLQYEDVEWRAPWIIPDEILYRCGDFDYVPLLGIWGAIGYAPLLVLRQFRSRQFIPETQGLAQCEFAYKGDNYKKKVREISNAWNETHRMKRFAANPMTTPEYDWWRGKRFNDNVPESSQENTRPIEEHLQNSGGKNKAEEDLDSLKIDYKKLRLSIMTADLGKTSEQWRQEIKEEKIRADQWEKKFQDARVREDALEMDLLESQNENIGLRTWLLAGGIERGENTVVNFGDDNEDPTYPLSFTLVNVQVQLDTYPRRVPVTIKPQQYQAGTSAPVNYPIGSSSNPWDNPTNQVVLDLDDMAEMDRARVELPKQLEDQYKWLEEKFRAMENVDYLCGVDAKELSLVPNLVLPPKFKTPEFEKYNETSCPKAHITMFCRRMTGYLNNDQLLIHCF